MFKRHDRDRKPVTTGRKRTERRDEVGDERREQAGKMNWS